MSRVVVKNLPKTITEEKIRQIFGEKGLLTDVQLKYTPDGKFRRFAFLGYQQENEAQEAINFFHNTFIQTNKISVEPCALLGDPKKSKSWSKYASDSTVFKNEHAPLEQLDKEAKAVNKKRAKQKERQNTAEILEKYKDDPMFEEFMQVHANELPKISLDRSTEETGETKEASESDESKSESDEVEDDKDKAAHCQISDLEYMKTLINKSDRPEIKSKKTQKKEKVKIQLFTVKLRDLPYSCRKKDIKHFFSPNIPFSIRLPRKIKGIAYAGFKTESQFKKALLKDRSFMSEKRISITKYSTMEVDNKQDQGLNLKQKKWKSQEESLKNEEDIAESGRIFIRNLAYSISEDDIQMSFSKFGPLTEVNLPVDPSTRKLKGFGVVTFLMPEHAVKAYSELDGSILQGRMLHLLPGIAKDSEPADNESSNYKKEKAKKQKVQAGSSHNWNSLFLGQNAVAEVIASTFGKSKKDVLDPHGSSNAAVRLALGETQIIATTRKYLEQEGVLLDAFNEIPIKRSKTIILVKNLPAETTSKEIYKLFEPFGIVGRVILPPSGVTAIVEFIEPSEARKAFTRLAYSKFKNLPLYLEWAPENSLTAKTGNTKENNNAENDKSETGTQELEKHSSENEEEDVELEEGATLFVKNLNFETTDQGLYNHFQGCGKVHYATVATKKDKNDPKRILSMGYGFVRFVSKASADNALKTLQQSSLDGKSLELKRSERTLMNEVTSARKTTKKQKQTGSKILVRNIPFQAKRNEIMELFKAFGEIKALRLPKKMTIGADSHRGFAFVDYFTASNAKQAFEALSQSTHLYGRRLVLEWASANDDVEEIRKRTADHFHPTEVVASKKSVFNLEKT